eukprot:m.8141 g.8141  ORF g.8141 m.8141 type:complete len:418 (-) comp4029_c0_seq1:24-1277(-)
MILLQSCGFDPQQIDWCCSGRASTAAGSSFARNSSKSPNCNNGMKVPFSLARARAACSFSATRCLCRSKNSRIWLCTPRILCWNVSVDAFTPAVGGAVSEIGTTSSAWYCVSGQKVPTIASDALMARIEGIHCGLCVAQCSRCSDFEQYHAHLHWVHRISRSFRPHLLQDLAGPSPILDGSFPRARTSATVKSAGMWTSSCLCSASPTPLATKQRRTAAPARIASSAYGSTVSRRRSRPTNCSVDPEGIALIALAWGKFAHAQGSCDGSANVLVHVLIPAHEAPAPETIAPGGAARRLPLAVTIEVMHTRDSAGFVDVLLAPVASTPGGLARAAVPRARPPCPCRGILPPVSSVLGEAPGHKSASMNVICVHQQVFQWFPAHHGTFSAPETGRGDLITNTFTVTNAVGAHALDGVET